MNDRRTLTGELARDYCLKYPSVSNLMLARMLYADAPQVYSGIEHARTTIRGYRGARGSQLRGSASRTGNLVDRLSIPPADPPKWEPYALPEGVKRWLILSDLHIPYHQPDAVALALDFAVQKQNRCDGVILLGDLLDCYQLSRFCKDPRARDMAGEIDFVDQLLDSIADTLRPKCMVWKAGNHELRLETYLMTKAPELFRGFADQFTFRRFLNLDQRKVKWVNAQSPIRHKHLTLLHGHEWQGGISSPVNPARGAFLRGQECIVVGHQHRTSEHTEPTLSGVTITTWSIGCLCNLHPDYAPLNKFNHGFAILHTGRDWRVENHRVVNGSVV